MNAIDYALKMELDGKAFYEKQSKESKDLRIKQIFDMLARDEQRHYDIINDFKKSSYNYKGTDTFKTTKNLFSEMMNKKENFKTDVNVFDIYKQAIEMEKKSVDLYLNEAKKSTNKDEKEILLKLSEEEKKHQTILENLMEFIRKGEEWVESPEFSHLDEFDKFSQRDKY
ncbi:ferritin family protein [Athalassotoga saccharophila]|uniref:ferritin family protein n=1 Tax=Athalassotoga saccharophila TaxID=1441386 RepID=UPI00137B5981|nr:ferritin family protein [Athalassotoga saccharophila]